MNLLDYIRGNRKGIEANRLERESMADPFMYDAIEGFDTVDGNHAERIRSLQDRIKGSTRTAKKHLPLWQSIAACAVVIFAIGGYFFIEAGNDSGNLHVQSENIRSEFIEIYIPDNYYSENIVVIAKHNSEAAKTYKPNDMKTGVIKDEDSTIQEQPIEETPINIYIPV